MESNHRWDQYDCLHPQVIKSLQGQGFTNPTSIQSEVFENYRHYYDFLVASQTGSGKTISFTAPIVSDLINLSQTCQLPPRPLCLILTPTRELAIQISQTLQPLLSQTPIKSICILGGLSQAKQVRILKQKHPHILIGTPGRIHELLQQQQINLQMLKFLVLDQADRMVQMGHYIELDGILKRVFKGKVEQFFQKDLDEINKRLDQIQKEQENQFYIVQNGKKKRLNLNLNNFQTQKLFQVPMQLFEVPAITPATQIPQSQKTKKNKKQKKSIKKQQKIQQQNPQVKLQGAENQQGEHKMEEQLGQQYSQLQKQLTQEQIQILNKLKRKVFFISATLTKQFKGTKYFTKRKPQQQTKGSSKSKSKSKSRNKFQKKPQKQQQGQLIPKLKALLSRINTASKPKIIDQSSQIFLPQKLTQLYTFCSSDIDKFTTILSYINQLPMNTSKIIIFTNTIRASKRVKFFLNSAGLKTVSLHSHMMQKMRLEKMEKFQKSKEANVLICTDVAARGLDFVITNVIQFSVPVNGDTYVHRVGRTARANRPGQALILISQKQITRWQQICQTLKLNSSLPQKYNPLQSTYDQLKKKVQQYQWIRLNQEKTQNKRITKLNEQQAQQFGFQASDEEQKRPKRVTDFQEEEQLRKSQVRKKIKEINMRNKMEEEKMKGSKGIQVGDGKVWKKNKLVMSLDQIKKYL